MIRDYGMPIISAINPFIIAARPLPVASDTFAPRQINTPSGFSSAPMTDKVIPK